MRIDEERLFNCKSCGQPAMRTPGRQDLCPTCTRRGAHDEPAPSAPPPPPPKQRRHLEIRRTVGIQMSQTAAGILYHPGHEPELAWITRLSFPFDYAISKNQAWARGANGQVRLRDEHRTYRDNMALIIRQALKSQPIKQNRLWLEILVQKPDHKGDAVNTVDAICDAIKHAIDLDDRWYSIRRLDWEIVKADPHIILGIGQENVDDVQACSTCGRLLELEAFPRAKGTGRFDRARDCRQCQSLDRSRRKDQP